MTEDRNTLLFVVAEPGSRWPVWLTHYQRVVPDVTVVAGETGGIPAELSLRVARRLEHMEHGDRQVQMAVILAGPHEAPAGDVFQARCLVAGSILKHMAGANRGKLVFAANETLSASERHELLNLVDTLTNQLVGTKLSISLRFESAAEAQSGTHRTSAKVTEVA